MDALSRRSAVALLVTQAHDLLRDAKAGRVTEPEACAEAAVRSADCAFLMLATVEALELRVARLENKGPADSSTDP